MIGPNSSIINFGKKLTRFATPLLKSFHQIQELEKVHGHMNMF